MCLQPLPSVYLTCAHSSVHWKTWAFVCDTPILFLQEGQAELVMFILLRLAEDVVTFQTLPIQRRRDIQTTMTQNMDKLFTFMLGILADSVSHYQQLVCANPIYIGGFT